MMKIDALASMPNYISHLAPIWHELPPENQGNFYIPDRLGAYAVYYGIEPTYGMPPYSPLRGGYSSRTAPQTVLLAGYQDMVFDANTRIVLLEHGIGQTYHQGGVGQHPAESGGPDRENINLFLCTNAFVQGKNQQAYPTIPAVVTGMPYMDYLEMIKQEHKAPVFSFHWDNAMYPESRWAWPYYSNALAELARSRKVYGHAHPRAWRRLEPWYRDHNIEPLHFFESAVKLAEVYACDNSSTLFQAAALGIPTVVLNDPTYRKDVSHGLRFWELADVGVPVWSPDCLAGALKQAATGATAGRAREISELLFPNRGKAASLAATATMKIANGEEV